MALGINTNVASLSAQNQLNKSQQLSNQALERLSSGLRINSAKDDAAGLAISTRFQSQISGLNVAQRNANDGISLAQTAEGALEETTNILQRIRDLSIQSSNSTNSSSDRAALQSEVNQLKEELTRIADTTQFNGLNLLNGDFTDQSFQVGANANQTISVSVGNASANALGNNSLVARSTDSAVGLGTPTEGTDVATIASNGVADQDVTISGYKGSTTISSIGGGAGATAKQIADAVNSNTADTGVTADASTTATLSGLSGAGVVSFELGTSGGSTAAISASVTVASDLTALKDEINSKSGTTGVTASINDAGGLELVNTEGQDITIDNFAVDVGDQTITLTGSGGDTATLDETGDDSAIVAGEVTFNSEQAFSVSSSEADTAGGIVQAGASTAVGSTQQSVSSIDIGTVDGASSAISVVDAALSRVNSIRADLGAIQNRFESTIANLATTSENLSAANSRILDADFAAETAKLSKSQVLQQAGISVLAQANARPQQVLSLLQ
ncbi:flagellin N-terminal helical domain-containing protein [Marinobacter adhaerens]|uniref:flagellin N-terminal helical domain-containing protein n=1 Tax=Marinobacter adhaerens TaxID=1033846 RepID=UPI001C565318|nr:flagellin [Marinobacter adhaerens]MBW3225991.1 flagellin [Marinobacter adhaerens]